MTTGELAPGIHQVGRTRFERGPCLGVSNGTTGYASLTNVHRGSAGNTNVHIRELNWQTITTLSRELAFWARHNHATRDEKLLAIRHIVDWDFDAAPWHTPYLPEQFCTVLSGVFRAKTRVRYSTWASLHDMLGIVSRANVWFSARCSGSAPPLEWQQKDLEQLIGDEPPRHEHLGIQ